MHNAGYQHCHDCENDFYSMEEQAKDMNPTYSSVVIEEQGLRDGLQSESQIIPTERKVQWLEQLLRSGIKRFQITSFVHPARVPQMADAEELCHYVLQMLSPEEREGIVFSALTLNIHGVERAQKAGLKHIAVSFSASDTHSRKNAHRSLQEAMQECAQMVRCARDAGMVVRGGIQNAFGCRYEGRIDEVRVLDFVRHHLDSGVDEIALADSTGMGNPVAIKRLMREVVSLADGKPVILHQHDTENKGIANVVAALDAGVRIFDTAFGGLGGCPFIAGATGNIATEDTIHCLHQMNISTGINIRAVAEVSAGVSTYLGKALPGKMYSLIQRNDVCW